MFAIKYALAKIYRNPLASISTLLLVTVTSASILLATSSASSLETAQKKALKPLEQLGADIVLVRQMPNNEGTMIDEFPEGIHKIGKQVFSKKHSEDKDYSFDTFTSFGVPLGLAGYFDRDEIKKIETLPKVKEFSSLLMASYSYYSQKQKKIVIEQENVQPKFYLASEQELRELEIKVNKDKTIQKLGKELKKILDKPEEELTGDDNKRIDSLSDQIGRRKELLYHQYRPDIFPSPPKRQKKVIVPEPPRITAKEFNVAGMEPDVGFLKKENIISGRYFTNKDIGKKVAILRADFAKKNHITIGDKFNLIDTDYEIIGIGWPGLGTHAPEMYVPLDTLQKQVNSEGIVNIIFIKASSGLDALHLKNKIQQLFPEITLNDNNDLTEVIKPVLKGSSQVLARYTSILSMLLGFVAVVTVASMSFSSVGKRAKEIATLRAIGWPGYKIAWYLLLDIIFLVLLGATIGIVTAIIFANNYSVYNSIPDYKMIVSTSFFGYLSGVASSDQVSNLEIIFNLTPSLTDYFSAISVAVLIVLISGFVVVWRFKKLKPAVVLRRP